MYFFNRQSREHGIGDEVPKSSPINPPIPALSPKETTPKILRDHAAGTALVAGAAHLEPRHVVAVLVGPNGKSVAPIGIVGGPKRWHEAGGLTHAQHIAAAQHRDRRHD